MEPIILALQQERSCWKAKEILESSGTALCLICRSADQVRRTARRLRVSAVVCGYKLGDQPAEALFEDLPAFCSMLVLAPQNLLDQMENDGIARLPIPVSRRDLIASVQMLLQMERRPAPAAPSRRPPEEQAVIDQAKQLLMDRSGMTEGQAHRFLQKSSMDRGVSLLQTARLVLDSGD